MKKSFAARRIPRKIGRDDDDDAVGAPPTPSDSTIASDIQPAPVQPSSAVKRPANKSRRSTALRTSFAPSSNEEAGDISTPSLHRKLAHARVALQRNVEPSPAVASDRPRTYSKDYLNELKQSTPSTPKDSSFRAVQDLDQSSALEIRDPSQALSNYQPPTIIPTHAEILEKKLRRARMAKEPDFMALDGDSAQEDNDEDDLDENVTRDQLGRLILKPKEKYAETRLTRDDEDLLEGFDDFTTDGKLAFSKAAEKDAAKSRKAEMAAMIADAERDNAQDSTDDDDSEAERNAAFEIAQTRHGTYATKDDQDQDTARPQTPPRIAPLSSLETVVERLRKRLEEMEMQHKAKAQEMQRLVAEKSSIGEQEVRVQAALKETGEKYAQLRQEVQLRREDQNGNAMQVDNGQVPVATGQIEGGQPATASGAEL
ncbi:hypothetical protein AAFC00_001786 [Neodothiora populina]|uniref:Spindle pole body-associated protein cut12 domain-containing protein n=1 Tax=Neodothiora populina TaxID=2781224 RepID=A0ABR3PQ49_9PEZI